MADYDGEIKLGVSLKPADIKRSASQLSTEISNIFKATAGKNIDSKFQSLQASMSKSVSKAQELTQQLYKLEQTQLPTERYSALQRAIDKTEKALEKLGNESIKLQKTGGDSPKAKARLQEIEVEAEKLQTRYADIEDRMYDMERAGTAFNSGSTTQKYQDMSNKLADVNNQMRVQVEKSAEYEQRAAQKSAKLASEKEKLAKATQKAKNAARDMAKSQKSVGNSLDLSQIKVKKLLGMIIKWGFGIRSLFVAYRKLRAAVSEAWKSMAQLDNGNNNVNRALSEFTSSLTYLKNSLGAAFAPILTVIAPILSQFVTMLADATNQVGMFFAALTGQKTFIKAIKNYKDYAKGIKDSNKEQKQQLASYDKLNNISSKDANGAGGADKPEDMFKKVPVDNGVTKWLDDLKKKLQPLIDRAKELADIFMNGFKDASDFLGLEDQVKDVIDTLGKIKQHLSDIFNDPEVQAHLQAFLDKVAYAAGQIVASLASMVLTVLQNILGGIEKYLDQNKERIKQYLISMFDIWGEIAEQLGNFFVAFADIFQAFASDEGKQLTANVIGIFADMYMGLTELAAKFVRDILILITQPIIDNEKQIKEVLTNFLGFLASITGSIKDIVDETFTNLNKMYDEHIKPLFESLTQGLSAIVKTILDNWQQYIQPVLDHLAQKFDEVVKQHIQPLINEVIKWIGNVVDVVKLLWENVIQPFITWLINTIVPVVMPIVQAVIDMVLTFAGHVADAFSGIIKTINGVIDFLVGVFTGDWDRAWKGVTEILEGVKLTITNIFGTIKDLFLGFLGIIKARIEAGLKVLGTLLASLIKLIADAYDKIKDGISSALKWVEEKFGGLKGLLSSIFNEIKDTVLDILKSLWNDVKDVINGILGFFEGLANGVVDAVNTVIDALNSLDIDVPDWVTEKFGIQDFGFSIPTLSRVSIPRLAQGAVIPPNAPFMAMLGDQKQGTNIEAPLSTIQEALYNALVQAGLTNRGQQSNNNQDIVVQIDGREIARAVRREDNIFKKSTGQSMFAY